MALSLLCFPTDRAAYGRLAQLISKGQRRVEKGLAALWLDDVIEYALGQILVVLPPPVPDASFGKVLERLRDAAPGRVYLAAQFLYRGDDRARIERLADLARRHRTPLIATGDVLYHTPERRPLQDVLTCVREKCTIDEAGLRLHANAERHLKPVNEIARLFRHWPEAVARTAEIVRACRFSLDELAYDYPIDRPPAGLTEQGWLEQLTWEGAAERYPDGVPDHVRELIRHEFRLIEELRYAPYFLTVYDIVRYARSRGILCQGRGSAANSAICYCLGVTAVDPSRFDLLFERFVSAERNEPPDIDVDFEHERREEVIQYIYRKYGREHAGIAATVIHYRTRSAIREVGKALGLSADVVGGLAGSIWGWSTDGVAPRDIEERGMDPDEPRVAMAVRLSRELIGFPRHLSQHVGGFVLTRSRLDTVVPVVNGAMPDRTFVEWDKDDLDALGILKIDVLGLGMLTCIRKAFELLERHHGEKLELASVPPEDAAVYEMLSRGDSLGVFQVESRAQMTMLPRLRPACFYDLIVEVAIVRPGPIQGDMVHPYLRRRAGLEPVAYPSGDLKQVLEKTLGVPLFQEQAMKIAIIGAGFTPTESDRLRRAMATFKRVGTIDRLGTRFIEGMVANGYERAFAEKCFKQIEGFGTYGFPESHAASFALLVYVSSWIKCHYPAVFAAALLNSQPMGFYAPAQIVRDAKDHGVLVLPVDVNASDWDATLEMIEPPADVPTIDGSSPPWVGKRAPDARLGLVQVRPLEHAGASRSRAPSSKGGVAGSAARSPVPAGGAAMHIPSETATETTAEYEDQPPDPAEETDAAVEPGRGGGTAAPAAGPQRSAHAAEQTGCVQPYNREPIEFDDPFCRDSEEGVVRAGNFGQADGLLLQSSSSGSAGPATDGQARRRLDTDRTVAAAEDAPLQCEAPVRETDGFTTDTHPRGATNPATAHPAAPRAAPPAHGFPGSHGPREDCAKEVEEALSGLSQRRCSRLERATPARAGGMSADDPADASAEGYTACAVRRAARDKTGIPDPACDLSDRRAPASRPVNRGLTSCRHPEDGPCDPGSPRAGHLAEGGGHDDGADELPRALHRGECSEAGELPQVHRSGREEVGATMRTVHRGGHEADQRRRDEFARAHRPAVPSRCASIDRQPGPVIEPHVLAGLGEAEDAAAVGAGERAVRADSVRGATSDHPDAVIEPHASGESDQAGDVAVAETGEGRPPRGTTIRDSGVRGAASGRLGEVFDPPHPGPDDALICGPQNPPDERAGDGQGSRCRVGDRIELSNVEPLFASEPAIDGKADHAGFEQSREASDPARVPVPDDAFVDGSLENPSEEWIDDGQGSRRRVGERAEALDCETPGTSSADHEDQGVSPSKGSAKRLALRLGFRQVKGLKEDEMRRLVAARGPGYPDLAGLRERARIGQGALDRLARADAFGSMVLDRRAAIWTAIGLDRTGHELDPPPLFAWAEQKTAGAEPAVELPAMTTGQHVAEDYRTLRLTLRTHPLALLRRRLPSRTIKAADLGGIENGQWVEAAGLVLVRQRPGTASGVIFITLEDETGVINLVVWPKVFERFRRVVLGAQMIAVKGQVQKDALVIHVIAGHLADRTDLLRDLSSAEIEAPVARADRFKRPNDRRPSRPSEGFETPLAHADGAKNATGPDPRDPFWRPRDIDDYRSHPHLFPAPLARVDEVKRNVRNTPPTVEERRKRHPHEAAKLDGFKSRDFH